MADIDPTQGSTLLGKQVGFPQHPDQAELECVPYLNLFKDSIGQFPPAIIRYTCPEFTSLCPKTGQPDFAHITIDYAPDKLLVESKALKLYMGSFRNHGMFHETTTLRIARDFCQACVPIWLRIIGIWYPRGGIPIDIFWQSGEPPKNAMLPMVNYKHYRGR